MSVSSDGVEGDGTSTGPCISADGRYVGFTSAAANLVANDTNGEMDVFVHDRQTETTTRVSVATGGTEADAPGGAAYCAISPDGRFVAFESSYTNLVANDTNGTNDIFVHDRQDGTTDRVNLPATEAEADELSAAAHISTDGRYVAFNSYATNLVADDTNQEQDVFLRDRQAGITTRISVSYTDAEADGSSAFAGITPDGRYVAFVSSATNLVPGDTNGVGDVFLYDRQTAETIRVSVDSDGNEATSSSSTPSISADGQRVAFTSSAPNLVSNDTNGSQDVFVRDLRQAGATLRASVDSDGVEGVDHSSFPSISADGRFVAFVSSADNLAPGGTSGFQQVFVHDLDTQTTTLVSVSSDGAEMGSDSSSSPVLSADGTWVAFQSDAPNLVPFDFNVSRDIFVRRWR